VSRSFQARFPEADGQNAEWRAKSGGCKTPAPLDKVISARHLPSALALLHAPPVAFSIPVAIPPDGTVNGSLG